MLSDLALLIFPLPPFRVTGASTVGNIFSPVTSSPMAVAFHLPVCFGRFSFLFKKNCASETMAANDRISPCWGRGSRSDSVAIAMPRKSYDRQARVESVNLSAGSRGTARLGSNFQARSFHDVTYIEGETLRRWCHRPYLAKDYDRPHPKAQFFLVYTPTPLQLETACDRCPTIHRPKNMACSANTAEQTSPFIDPLKLYNYLTPKVSARYNTVHTLQF